ncbi:hypothetical protein PILCRDRAFT_14027 [Piloderma croceum F 1598]|uniref:Uncharacterized protein n=1 Tax=Piloderma croceum (strain F 1598) TaxID=765440 RepID=A0A0C3AM33_PILCF|nr:hypothetical protein PILCRDRAFT_14027 [Piloderma croceum F 1598]
MEENYPATEILRQKFRSLISLTQIVSAINNDGHPTLPSAADNKPSNVPHEWQIFDDILDAIANILVRKDEVVAVALSGSTIVAVQGQEEQEVMVTTGSESDSANADQLDAEQEVEVTMGSESDSANAKQLDVDQLDADADTAAAAAADTDTAADTDAAADADQLDTDQSASVADNKPDFEPRNYSKILVSGIAAVVNPQLEDEKHYTFPEGCQCMLIPKGKSHLPKARLAPDQLCNRFLKKIEDGDPLANHISTVEDYLRNHRQVLDVTDRANHENLFALYLVAQCWPKMLRRISSWSSQGYILMLSKVKEEELRTSISSGLHPNRSNHDLARIVLIMVKRGVMESMIMKACGKPSWSSEQLTNLVAMFTQLKEPGTPQQHDYMYGPTTCIEFHRLLLATLLAFGKALFALKDTPRMSGTDWGQKCQHVWFCGGLLREIASSLMLRQHLQTCQKWLSIPINKEVDLKHYQDYTGFPLLVCRNPNTDNPAHDDGGDISLDGSESLDQVFLKWIRLLQKSLSEIPPVSLLAVRFPKSPLPLEPWETTVDYVVGNTPGQLYNAKDVKNIILSYIQSAQQTQNPLITKWKPAIHGHKIHFDCTIHCESALGSLATYALQLPFEQIKDYSELKELLQNIDQTLIGISKRCCPGCWELLEVLNGPHRFGARGHHPTVFQVELPPWLPKRAVKEMVARFSQILREQIFIMMLDRAKQRQARRSSNQSASASSTGSHRKSILRADIDSDMFGNNDVALDDGSDSSVASED